MMHEGQAETWALVEVMGHRSHVGRVSEVRWLGVEALRVEALQRDGSFVEHKYTAGALFGVTAMTEEAARRSVLPRSYNACDAFVGSVVLATHCQTCGKTEPEHLEPRAALQARVVPCEAEANTGDEEEGEAEDDLPI